jgi:3-keto-disaccharide hydrolase
VTPFSTSITKKNGIIGDHEFKGETAVKHILSFGLFVALSWVVISADYLAAGGGKPPPGFTPLFNGTDLTGWKNAAKQAEFWKVEEGLLHYTGKGGQNLMTDKNYKNFEMWVDWKITKGGDSGVYLRGRPQVQIWDNPEGSGGLWNNPKNSPGKVPLLVADKKPGKWNTFYIKMVGTKVTVKLNGKLVVDDAVMLDGKVPPTGPIELQVHGTPLWFKNVFVKELE